jgi:hypothetical protein
MTSQRSLAALAAVVAGLTALLAVAPVAAEVPEPYGDVRGTFVEVGFGGNGLTDDEYVDDTAVDADVGPLVGLFAAGGYRPIDYLSVGLLAHFGFLDADIDDVDTEFSAFLGVLVEVRGHFPIGRFDPWVGVGVGYAMTYTHGAGDTEIPFFGDVEYDYRLMLHGVGIGLGLGLDIWVTTRVAITPFFRMILGGWATACLDVTWDDEEEHDCDDVEDVYEESGWLGDPDDLPHLWIVGASVTFSP